MNPLNTTVLVFRTQKGAQFKANIEFEQGVPFAVLYQYWPKGTTEIKIDRVRLDPRLLTKVDREKWGVDYHYKGDPMIDPAQNSN